MKFVSIFFLVIALFTGCTKVNETSKPKLIVGIVIDQMRPEYLYRFYDHYSENGFKRLMREGFICNNVHINYVPTVTGPGHASIYSGTTPKYHGIVEHSWYDRNIKKSMYCVYDSLVSSVGTEKPGKGSYSARNLLASNIADQLKIATGGRAKVISMSLKDRGATMPAGHMADGAFWYDVRTGNFVSSTYYMDTLPKWVKNFNNRKLSQQYLEKTWDLMLPAKAYENSISDYNNYEITWTGKKRPVFPYKLRDFSDAKKPFYPVYETPYGNTILTDLAVDALANGGLGKNNVTDLLAISYSSTDAIGHAFGPLSKEINDTYYRLDKEIARLLESLDKYIGKQNYMVFVTADHGMGEVPKYLSDHKMDVDYIDTTEFKNNLNLRLTEKFGKGDWIECILNNHIYLDRELIKSKGMDLETVQKFTATALMEVKGIAEVYTATQLLSGNYEQGPAGLVQRGFQYGRCGDVIYILKPGWAEEMDVAATHGSPYNYDTNIPLIWLGTGIRHSESYKRYNVTDIAPTVSAILKIQYPSACIGNPITEILDR